MKNEQGYTIIELFILVWIIIGTGMTIHGLYLAFTAHVIIGVVFIFLQPMPAISSAAYILFDYNIPAEIAKLF
jgi:hypothetical protein